MGTWLVSGASGFLGRALCSDLVARGVDVRALVRRAESAPPGTDVHVVRSLTDADALAHALAGVETVVHLAARAHVMRETAADPLAAYREVNVEGTRAVLASARSAGVARFVFVSSVKAVGEWNERPWTDAVEPHPSGPYGVSKLEAERLVRSAAAEAGLHAPILRLPLVYGPGAKGNILQLFDAVARGIPLPFAWVRNQRSLLYSGNFIAALHAVLAAPAAARETYFVTDGHDLSTPELIRLISAALGRRPRLLPVPPAAFRALARLGDRLGRYIPVPFDSQVERRLLSSLALDITRLRETTGYTPPHKPAEGLRQMGAWYLGRGKAQ